MGNTRFRFSRGGAPAPENRVAITGVVVMAGIQFREGETPAEPGAQRLGGGLALPR